MEVMCGQGEKDGWREREPSKQHKHMWKSTLLNADTGSIGKLTQNAGNCRGEKILSYSPLPGLWLTYL